MAVRHGGEAELLHAYGLERAMHATDRHPHAPDVRVLCRQRTSQLA